jgi:hypothetical protein
MAVAAEPGDTHSLDWSTGILKKRYYDTLLDIHFQYNGYEEEDYAISGGELSGIINDYKYTFPRHIHNEVDIQISSINTDSTNNDKVILVHCRKGLWQACCHFEEAGSSANNPPIDSSVVQHSAPQSLVGSMSDQTPRCAVSTGPEVYDNSANGNDTSSPADSTTEKTCPHSRETRYRC